MRHFDVCPHPRTQDLSRHRLRQNATNSLLHTAEVVDVTNNQRVIKINAVLLLVLGRIASRHLVITTE